MSGRPSEDLNPRLGQASAPWPVSYGNVLRMETTVRTPGTDPMWNFRAPRPLVDELDRRAQAEGVSRSEVIREAVRRYVEEPAPA